MEIVTYVLEGALAHQDSTGAKSVIAAGEVQRMSAGTGIRHSEYNASENEPVHFLQIWVEPVRNGLLPSYEQRALDLHKDGRGWLVVASPGAEATVTIHQDVELGLLPLEAGQRVTHRLAPGRYAWVHAVRGTTTINDKRLEAGDGAGLVQEEILEFAALDSAEVLVFDLA
jgi:redox-sensitive bicupin YhaK (pirin superfamily)